jgi:phage tail sheath protein FI
MAEVILSPGVFQQETDQSLYAVSPQVIGAALVGPTVLGQPFVPTYVTNYNQYKTLFGDIFKSGSYYYEYFTSMAAKEYFNNGGQTLLVTRVISGSDGVNTYATSSVPASGSATAFVLETRAWGSLMNNSGSLGTNGALESGSIYNVRWEVAYSDSNTGLFTLLVRRGDDNDNQKNVLETWSNLSMDPQQPNYISRVVGDLKPVPDFTEYVVNFSGSYEGSSRYVRVKSIKPIVDSIDNNGNFKTALSGSLPVTGSGAFKGGLDDTDQTRYMYDQAGSGSNNIQGFDESDYVNAFRFLEDKDGYQFNMLLAPGITLDGSTAADQMITTVENRGDAIAIIDNGPYGTSINDAVGNTADYQSSYAATYYPWVQLFSQGLGKAIWCPPSTVVGGAIIFNDSVGAEWFAPAGLNRGGIPSVIKAEVLVPQADRDLLYIGRVNPLATFPGAGVVIWGQKTLQKKPSALDRVNVRRLLINLKGFIGSVARTLVFEQNTTATRNKFLAQVNPYLSSVVQRQGLYAFKVVMDDTNNTPDVIDRNQLVGQIYVQPTKTAEFIILNFNILPTGAEFPA